MTGRVSAGLRKTSYAVFAHRSCLSIARPRVVQSLSRKGAGEKSSRHALSVTTSSYSDRSPMPMRGGPPRPSTNHYLEGCVAQDSLSVLRRGRLGPSPACGQLPSGDDYASTLWGPSSPHGVLFDRTADSPRLPRRQSQCPTWVAIPRRALGGPLHKAAGCNALQEARKKANADSVRSSAFDPATHFHSVRTYSSRRLRCPERASTYASGGPRKGPSSRTDLDMLMIYGKKRHGQYAKQIHISARASMRPQAQQTRPPEAARIHMYLAGASGWSSPSPLFFDSHAPQVYDHDAIWHLRAVSPLAAATLLFSSRRLPRATCHPAETDISEMYRHLGYLAGIGLIEVCAGEQGRQAWAARRRWHWEAILEDCRGSQS